MGEEQIDHRARHELGDPAAATGRAVERALVVPLDEDGRIVDQQGPEEAGDEVRAEVGDVRVEEDDHVPARRLECGSHRLALASGRGLAGDHPRPRGRGDARRLVGRAVVGHHDLVDEGDAATCGQGVDDGGHDHADGRCLVASGDADRHDAVPLAPDERGRVEVVAARIAAHAGSVTDVLGLHGAIIAHRRDVR